MSTVDEKERAANSLGGIIRAMFSDLRSYWLNAEGYQKLLYFVGFLLLASAIFHTCVLIITSGALEGDISFRKAVTFGEAFGLTVCMLSWFITFLPQKRTLWWTLSIVYAAATFIEVFLVTLQVWRGVPSHFNFSTPIDAAVFRLMGVSISLHVPLILSILVLSFHKVTAPTSLKWAIRSAMVLLIASLGFGFVMITNGSNTVGLAGQVKIPHALGLHALQILPGLAWLLMYAHYSEKKRTQIVFLGIIGYCILMAIFAFQALNGVAAIDLELPATIIVAIGATILVLSLFWAIKGLRHKTITS